MKTMTVGKFKADFSQVLKEVELGKEIVVTYGKNAKKIAVLSPYKQSNKSLLGLLSDKGGVEFSKDFKMTTEEFLGL